MNRTQEHKTTGVQVSVRQRDRCKKSKSDMFGTMTLGVSVVLCALAFMGASSAWADTITFKNGGFLKGFIISEYDDRYLINTSQGEKEILKVIILKVEYDDAVKQKLHQGIAYERKGNLVEAQKYYEEVLKLNPEKMDAKEKLVELKKKILRQQASRSQSVVLNRDQLGKWTPNDEEKQKSLLRLKLDHLKETTGLTIEKSEEGVSVTAVTSYSPAFHAGIRSGDSIVKVYDQDIKYMDLAKILEILDGPTHTELRLKILREVSIPKGSRDYPLDAVLIIGSEGLQVEKVKAASDYEVEPSVLREGDRVTAIKDKNTRYMSLDEAYREILDGNTQEVEISIMRTYTLWRD